MKSSKIIIACAAALLAVSCGPKATVEGRLEDAAGKQVVVKVLDGNIRKTLDTLTVGQSGSFRYSLPVEAGDPRFLYFYYGDTKIASLLLEASDKVSVAADTLGNWTVTGSPECEKLRQVEMDHAAFLAGLATDLAKADEDPSVTQEELNRALSRRYVDYHRQAIKYVVTNAKSLTVIPVLYQRVNETFAVFSQRQDAIYFRSAADSLKTVYPECAYVKALDKEAERRSKILELDVRMQDAQVLSYPEIELPGTDGEKKKLSDLESKVVLVMFWNAADPAQKMFNIDSLLPLYERYHARGFDIYAINVDADKVGWGTTVRKQQLPWVNVCDGLGAASPALLKFNVGVIPSFYVIVDGELYGEPVEGTDGLEKLLKKFC